MKKVALTFAFAALVAGSATAQVDVAVAEACFTNAVATQADPATCIISANAACMVDSTDTPAVATLCLSEAQQAWSIALASRIQSTLAGVDDRTAAVARIELKYDLLANLMQCDRLEELSKAASELTGSEIMMQTMRCQSAASGLTYVRLYLRDQTRETSQ